MNTMVRELNLEELEFVSGAGDKKEQKAPDPEPALEDNGNGGGGTWYDWNGDGDSWDEGATILYGAAAVATAVGALPVATAFGAAGLFYEHVDDTYF